jgi:hypothetical protein
VVIGYVPLVQTYLLMKHRMEEEEVDRCDGMRHGHVQEVVTAREAVGAQVRQGMGTQDHEGMGYGRGLRCPSAS